MFRAVASAQQGAQLIGMAAGAQQCVHLVQHGADAIELQAAYGAGGGPGPDHLPSVDEGVVDLRPVMVLGGHPEHGDHGALGGAELLCQAHHVEDLERQIQRPGEEAELVAGGDGKRVRFAQQGQVGAYLRPHLHLRVLPIERVAERPPCGGIEHAVLCGSVQPVLVRAPAIELAQPRYGIQVVQRQGREPARVAIGNGGALHGPRR